MQTWARPPPTAAAWPINLSNADDTTLDTTAENDVEGLLQARSPNMCDYGNQHLRRHTSQLRLKRPVPVSPASPNRRCTPAAVLQDAAALRRTHTRPTPIVSPAMRVRHANGAIPQRSAAAEGPRPTAGAEQQPDPATEGAVAELREQKKGRGTRLSETSSKARSPTC